MVKTIRSTLDIDAETLDQLLIYAQTKTDSTDLKEFTDLVNTHYDKDDKIALLDCLWKVAFADCRLDYYEEQFITKAESHIDVSDDEVAASKERMAP